MNVLSLFDGMSCLQIALIQLNKKPSTYYASEIDKYAIQQTQLNFPNTIQLGSVTEWRNWNIDWQSIDFIGAGSPCQGFSFAGKRLAFDDPRSVLFFVFIDILNHVRKFNPNVKFLLENVDMIRAHMKVINDYTGVFAVNINSNLVSAQNRSRWYWSNIRTKEVGLFNEVHTDIPQPTDKGILLRDVLEKEVAEKYYLSDAMLKNMEIWADLGNGIIGHSGTGGQKGSIFNTKNKIGALCATDYKQAKQICVAQRGRGNNNEQQLEPSFSGKTNCLTNVQKDNLIVTANYVKWPGVGFDQDHRAYFEDSKSGTLDCKSNRQKVMLQIPEATQKGFIEVEPGDCFDFENPTSKTRRGRKMDDKSNCLMAKKTDFMYYEPDLIGLNENQRIKFNTNPDTEKANCLTLAQGRAGSSSEYMDSISKIAKITRRIRRLTPLECSRLQTIPDWYKWECSDTQIYRMCGNGWTIDVISHILSFL